MANKKNHKLYVGVKESEDAAGPQKISVIEYCSSGFTLVRPLKHIEWHSPDGFQWGFAGSGPADAALSILYDYTGDMSEAKVLHQYFKFDFVAKMKRCLLICDFEMDEWLEKKRKEVYGDTHNKS